MKEERRKSSPRKRKKEKKNDKGRTTEEEEVSREGSAEGERMRFFEALILTGPAASLGAEEGQLPRRRVLKMFRSLARHLGFAGWKNGIAVTRTLFFRLGVINAILCV